MPDAEAWTRGPPLADIKRLASYGADGYNWRRAEAKLSQLPNFITKVDVDGFGTYDVHFVHQKIPPRMRYRCCSLTDGLAALSK